MLTILESQLALLERLSEDSPASTPADRVLIVEDLIALHVVLYLRLEHRLGQDGVTEAHRPLVPLFVRWLHTARRIKGAACALRREGLEVASFDLLLRTINYSKEVAEGFDYFVRLNERLARGEWGDYRPLEEVMEELRRRDQSGGQATDRRTA